MLWGPDPGADSPQNRWGFFLSYKLNQFPAQRAGFGTSCAAGGQSQLRGCYADPSPPKEDTKMHSLNAFADLGFMLNMKPEHRQ